jgi:hypothetical protein
MKKIFAAVAVLFLCSAFAHAAPKPRPQDMVATADGLSPTITSVNVILPTANGGLAAVADPPCPGTPTPPHCTNLSWTPSADGAANPTLAYNIYRGAAVGGESTTPINASPVAAACTSTTTCVYTDTNVSAGATYYYTAKATLNGGFSAASNEVSVQIPIAAPTLSGSAQ